MSTEQQQKFYVYLGVRRAKSAKGAELHHALRMRDPANGTFETEEHLYAAKRGTGPSLIGGIYSGVFGPGGTAYGFSHPAFTGERCDDREQVIEWEALDAQARTEAKRAKLERELSSELLTVLLPIRRRYHAALRRGDYLTADALASATTRFLRVPVKAGER